MSDDPIRPCACKNAGQFDLSSPQMVQRSYDIAASLVEKHECLHVGVQDLRLKDCKACAVYFANCFDDKKRCLKCNCCSDGTLLMFGLRRQIATRNKNSVMTTIRVEAAPADSLWIQEGDEEEDGKSVFKGGTKVMHPWYRKLEMKNTWNKRVLIEVRRSREPVIGTITVGLKVSDGTSPMERAIPLNVIIPPDGVEENAEPEMELPVIETVSTAVVTKSVELLLQEGWKFFKKHGPVFGDNDIIQLNIGSASLTEESASQDSLDSLISDATRKMQGDPTPVLKGLNTHLDNLYIHMGSLYETLGRVTAKEQPELRTQIAIANRDIAETQDQIWAALKSTGQFQLQRRPRLG